MNDNIKNKELGKGIGALIKDYSEDQNNKSNLFININQIVPNKNNPREYFDKEKLEQLKESIYQHGILQPLTIRKIDDNKYELISGGRRFEAIKQLSTEYEDVKFKKVPVFIKDVDSESLMTELALIENIQRSDLNPVEEAFAFSKLKINFNMSDQQIADSVGRSRSTITNSIRLLNFMKNVNVGKKIIEALQAGNIDGTDFIYTAGHARPLLDLMPDIQEKIFNKTIQGHLSVRKVELEAKKYKILKKSLSDLGNKKRESDDFDQLVAVYRSNLSDFLSTNIDIKINKKGNGKLVIHFQNDKELQNIIKNKILR